MPEASSAPWASSASILLRNVRITTRRSRSSNTLCSAIGALMGRRIAGNGVFGIGPPGSRQIVQRDADTPLVRCRPYENHAEQRDRGQPDDEISPDDAEVDDDDDRG